MGVYKSELSIRNTFVSSRRLFIEGRSDRLDILIQELFP